MDNYYFVKFLNYLYEWSKFIKFRLGFIEIEENVKNILFVICKNLIFFSKCIYFDIFVVIFYLIRMKLFVIWKC